MKVLNDILYKVHLKQVTGNISVAVKDVQTDSRKVSADTLFIAVKGTQVDGHDFIAAAIVSGSKAIICEVIPEIIDDTVTYVLVDDAQEAIAVIATNYYDHPSKELKLVGVTGTNGKTTIATLLFKLFTEFNFTCGLISTVQNQIGDTIIPSTHTTPDAIALNALLRQMVNEGCVYVFMECSSHAIHQKRIFGLEFTGALFSNITHDHLDYHKTFDEYIKVKKTFFDNLSSEAFAISNKDDKRGEVMLQNTKAKKHLYSLRSDAEYKGRIIENSLLGLHMMVNNQEVHFRLIGEFNAYNLLAVYGAAVCLGKKPQDVLTLLSSLTGAEGRFEYIVSNQQITGIVDYAHTPDALENVLSTINKLRKGNEKVITVVGCGGNRDKTKRPVMAKVACDKSDKVIITSDNPRNEVPADIINDMIADLDSASKKKYIAIEDRKEAIKLAVSMAEKDDIILVAGKGHEKYQDIKGVKHPFDDKQVLEEMFEMFNK